MSRLTKATKDIRKVVRKRKLTAPEFKDITKRVREKEDLRIERPKRRVDIDHFNDVDLALYLKTADEMGRGLMERTLYETAMRVTAFTRLQIRDVRLLERQVFVRKAKGNKQRLIPIHDVLVEELREYIDARLLDGASPKAPLFPAQHGGHFSTRRMQQIQTDIGKKAGLHAYAHKLRKTKAMWLLRMRMPLPAISLFLGHEDTSVTEKFYARMGVSMVADELDALYERLELVEPPRVAEAVVEYRTAA